MRRIRNELEGDVVKDLNGNGTQRGALGRHENEERLAEEERPGRDSRFCEIFM